MIQIEGYNVRIVARGDGYGVDDAIVHTESEPLVEFYDGRTQPASRRGQFVSRYYLTTLMGSFPKGLPLDSQWANVSPAGMRELQRYLRGYLQEAA